MASVLSGVAGLVTGVAITLYLFPKQQILTIESKPDKSEIPFGAPSPSEVVKRYRGFDVSYDRRVKMASWAYEKITAVSIRGDAKRTNKFFPDRSEVDSFRVAPSDYTNSGYDRGHLVPANDLKSSQMEMEDSFVMTNVCPMNPQLNRKYWLHIENFVRRLTEHFTEVHVFTGPLFIPTYDDKTQEWSTQYRVFGGKVPLVSVPTHFFKIVLGLKVDQLPYLGCFVVPNKEIDSNVSLTSLQVPLKTIESFSGHLFFPELRSRRISDLCEEVSCELIKGRFKQINK